MNGVGRVVKPGARARTGPRRLIPPPGGRLNRTYHVTVRLCDPASLFEAGPQMELYYELYFAGCALARGGLGQKKTRHETWYFFSQDVGTSQYRMARHDQSRLALGFVCSLACVGWRLCVQNDVHWPVIKLARGTP